MNKESDGRNHKDRHSSEAQSNAATDNESEHRSEAGESFTQTNHEVAHAIMEVTKKVIIAKIWMNFNAIYRDEK